MNNEKLKESKITKALLDFALLIMKNKGSFNSPVELEDLVREHA